MKSDSDILNYSTENNRKGWWGRLVSQMAMRKCWRPPDHSLLKGILLKTHLGARHECDVCIIAASFSPLTSFVVSISSLSSTLLYSIFIAPRRNFRGFFWKFYQHLCCYTWLWTKLKRLKCFFCLYVKWLRPRCYMLPFGLVFFGVAHFKRKLHNSKCVWIGNYRPNIQLLKPKTERVFFLQAKQHDTWYPR